MVINRDLNIDQYNRDIFFGHNRAALLYVVKSSVNVYRYCYAAYQIEAGSLP